MSYKNKIFIVSGAFSGIGLAITEKLLKSNFKVVAIGKTLSKKQRIYLKFKNFRKYLDLVICDLGNLKDVDNLSIYLKKKYKKIDGLVNNVGINPSRSNIFNTNIDDWNQTLNINLTSIFWLSKKILPYFKYGGSIVNISSVAAKGMKNRISYSSSKAALIGFTKSLAIDCANKKIRVNCILPGYIKTNLVKKYLKNLSKLEKKELIEKHALHRMGKPSDVANAVNFFLSDNSSWITGAILNVDGGYLLNTQKLR